MKLFNITAQVYEMKDTHKQTVLFNSEVIATSEEQAIDRFKNYYLVPRYELIKIYSVEEISQVAS